MDASIIQRAFEALGDRLGTREPIEVLLVGGAAGMLTGVLSASRTTVDCEVMVYVRDDAMGTVELAADAVSEGWDSGRGG